jgi:uncharacterized protein YuzE
MAKIPINHFEYSADIDSLHIFGDEQSDIAGSLRFENLIYDVDTSGKIIGLEIDNASKLFNTSPELLKENIKEAFLNVKVSNNVLLMGFVVMVQKEKFNFSYIFSRDKIALTC